MAKTKQYTSECVIITRSIPVNLIPALDEWLTVNKAAHKLPRKARPTKKAMREAQQFAASAMQPNP